MKIEDLLSPELDVASLAPPADESVNPFLKDWVLDDAQLLDLRFDAKTGIAVFIFELRQAYHLREGNTGLLIAHGLRSMEWEGPARETVLSAWPVDGSKAEFNVDAITFELIMWPSPGARLKFTATDVAFVDCEVAGLPLAPPDYGDVTPSEAALELAGWQSEFVATSVAVGVKRPARRKRWGASTRT